MKLFLPLVFLLIFSFKGLAEELSIISNPIECVVYVKNAETGKRVKVGKTPFKGDLDQISRNITDGNVFMIEVEKPGFETYRILLTRLSNVDMKLSVNLEVDSDMRLTQDFDLLSSELFDVQRMVRNKDYNNSLEKLKILEKKFPHFSIVYEMQGSVYYLMKEFKKSLSFYRKAFGVNPKNREAFMMKSYLENKFKLDTNPGASI